MRGEGVPGPKWRRSGDDRLRARNDNVGTKGRSLPGNDSPIAVVVTERWERFACVDARMKV